MRSRLSRLRPKPGVVLGAIAVFFAIGGIGYAAATIGTNDIKNGAVTKKKLHKNAVVSKKVKNHSLLCKDLKQGCVAGPRGATGATGVAGPAAGNASTVNGLSVNKIFFKAAPSTAASPQFSAAGLTLSLGCNAAGDPIATVTSATADVSMQGEANVNPYSFSTGFTNTSILGGLVRGSGRLTYSNSTGTVLTMLYGFDDSFTFNGQNVCTFRATVISG
jgi:hypothetical protein